MNYSLLCKQFTAFKLYLSYQAFYFPIAIFNWFQSKLMIIQEYLNRFLDFRNQFFVMLIYTWKDYEIQNDFAASLFLAICFLNNLSIHLRYLLHCFKIQCQSLHFIFFVSFFINKIYYFKHSLMNYFKLHGISLNNITNCCSSFYCQQLQIYF